MRKLLFSLLFVGAFATAANAQKEFANIELPMNRAEDLVSVADDNGNVCIYYYQGGNLNFALISPTGQKRRSTKYRTALAKTHKCWAAV
ncbi:hypothetical protein GCM10028895_36350 [Pontibacter rugosus]